MRRLLLAVGICTLCLTGPVADLVAAQTSQPPANETPEQRWARLQAETARIQAERQAERARYEQGVRDAATARAQYERDLARNQQDVRRANEAQADYERRMADRQRAIDAQQGTTRTTQAVRDAQPTTYVHTRIAPSAQCQEQARRRRGRGRLIGGLIGGVAGVAGSQIRGVGALAALAVPAGVLLGDAIASRLDCHEQQQAAIATEDAVRGGVGTTTTWTSETRPNVTGTSTVTATRDEGGGATCVDVTDVVIVDGQETRAPKRLCRRPPSNRYVRV